VDKALSAGPRVSKRAFTARIVTGFLATTAPETNIFFALQAKSSFKPILLGSSSALWTQIVRLGFLPNRFSPLLKFSRLDVNWFLVDERPEPETCSLDQLRQLAAEVR
jgi:hypothetical protein